MAENASLVRMFEHNRWANLRLMDACMAAEVDPALLEEGIPGTFGPIRATMAHVAGAEARYLDALDGRYRRTSPIFEETDPDMATIRALLERTGAELVAAARAAGAERMVPITRPDTPPELPASMFLVQAINHATEHRAQVSAILTTRGVEPPEMDGWTFYGVG